MARFDVYRSPDGRELLVDCQANLLSQLRTRFVVPLESSTNLAASRLNPIVLVGDRRFVLLPQGAKTVLARELGEPVASLREQDTAISDAIDMLLTGV